jgi:hypothetical protein
MAKAMSIGGMAVAAIAGLAFLGDMIAGLPFGGQSLVTDISFLLAAAMLGFASFSAFREAK